ncbi:MAG TPA: PAS domain S-box protein [Candidatus Binatia bacterium]|nr:PAS domain S-box protein [Candidatus Binatia bacterium]
MPVPKANPEVCIGVEPDPVSRRIENRFRQLLEAAPDAILEVNAEGRITVVNAAAEKIFGYTRAELIGQNIEMLVPEDKRSVHARYRAGYAQNPRVRPMGPGLELEAQRKDGTRLPVEISLSPNRSHEAENVIAIVRDVSQRNHMETMLRLSQERLRQAEKLESLGRLAGGVAHEFNNLLSMILGYSELLLPTLESDASKTYVAKISTSAKRAASLTRQLLAFGRRQVLSLRSLDMNDVVTDNCQIASRLLDDSIEMEVHLAPEPAWIKADPAQIEQIIANLASNAQAAMPQGGKMAFAVSTVEIDDAHASQYPSLMPGKYVVLSVSDTGEGMKPEVKARLFEPFFSTREFGQGTGLGLASMYGIVLQSGGGVSVQSEPGKGTTFQVFLPRVQSDAPSEPAVAPRKDIESLRGTETILLVEDHGPLLELAREFLSGLGYQLLPTNLPLKALEISSHYTHKIDLLLTDVLMPGMNGRELAQQLRIQRPDMKVLYVSGFADRAFEEGDPSGPEAFMEKPYEFDEIARKIREIL